jgi:hypothetical protein
MGQEIRLHDVRICNQGADTDFLLYQGNFSLGDFCISPSLKQNLGDYKF